MPDPFEALRSPLVPAQPDPAFATRLRARMERALRPGPGGLPASGAAVDAPAGLVPYVIVADARRALAWYEAALGATRRGEPMVMPDGRIGHAELDVGGGMMYLADESPDSHVAAPRPGEDARVSLHAEIGDVDRAVTAAVAAGATLERPAADHPYGRNAVIRDPFGHRWILSGVPTSPAPERARQGDIGYVSLWVPDASRAATFFGTVLGWTYGPEAPGHARQVDGATPSHGIHGGHGRPDLFLCYQVDDLDEALDRVRMAGGEAGPSGAEPWGRTAMCHDDQGAVFALYEARSGGAGPRGPRNGARQGDVCYLTMEVVDSARARAFYRAVLGWRFEPGRVSDGWGTVDVVPMAGLQGGASRAAVVPMYRVDDIGAAVERVRAAGGTSTDPEPQPYGISAQCSDDQGTRFHLGQL